jgi:hypothetical protein
MENHSVFIVMVNTTGAPVSVEETGYVVSYNSENSVTGTNNTAAVQSPEYESDTDIADFTGPVSGVFTGGDGQTVVRHERHEKDQEIFDAIKKGKLKAPGYPDMAGGSGRLLRSGNSATTYAPAASTLDTKKTFWVLGGNGKFIQVAAVLRADGTHSKVWVQDINYDDNSFANNDDKITSKQAEKMAKNFDEIYEKETAVFGYEHGGGLAQSVTYGGADCDPDIQILVYDIDGDYSATQMSGVFGYFFMGDEFSQAELNKLGSGMKTNQAEIFYIDTHFTDIAPSSIYSTLAHEFQHMINFNQKTIKSGYKMTAGVWYNEMLSMLAEDLIDPFISIPANNGGHPIKNRIPEFLKYYYFEDPTVWLNVNNVLHSYANAYALGAYLVRNFGGVNFIKKIMSDTMVDIASLDSALGSDANPLRSSVSSFTYALKRYGEVMMFNRPEGEALRPAGVLSFNNTVKSNVGGTGYEFSGFDIWKIGSGPYVWDTNEVYSLKPRTMLLQSNPKWQNVTGTLNITLQPPSVSGVELYIMVR